MRQSARRADREGPASTRASSFAEAQVRIEALEAELAAARAREAATAEVLDVINSSPGDLAPVFNAILERALDLCEAKCGNITIYDGEAFNFVAAAGQAEFDEWVRRNGPARPGPGTTMERMIRGEQVVHVADIANDEVYRAGSPVRKALVEIGGFRTFLGVALRKDNALLGILHIYRQEVRPFSDKQIALLQNFAAEAVIAMESARLLTETREALEQQTATAEVLQVINSSPGDLAPVFDAMLEKAMRLCEAAFGVLHTYDGGRFDPVAMKGVPDAFAEFLKHDRPAFGRGTGPARLLEGQRVVHDVDLANTEPYRAGEPNRVALVELGGARSLVIVPLLKDEVVCGAITIYRQEPRRFTDKQVALLQNFADQAVIAIENARLIAETREALEQQTATAEVLQVINSSPGNLAPVFDAMLEKALRLCEASCGHFRTSDGELLHLVAARGVPDAYAEFLRTPVRPSPGNPLGRMLRGERVVVSLDALPRSPTEPAIPCGAPLSTWAARAVP